MDPLRDLLAIDHRQALEFFFLGLQDVSEPTVDRQELAESGVDVAIHTHAQTCCRSKFSRATVGDLGDVVHLSWRSSADLSRICLEATTAIVPLENGSTRPIFLGQNVGSLSTYAWSNMVLKTLSQPD